jgi:heat shock protein HtpX
MALFATGLSTHIFNNNLKSLILLALFPFLFVVMIFAFFALLQGGVQMAATPAGTPMVAPFDRAVMAGIEGVKQYGGYAFLAAGLWFVIAFFFHSQMVRGAVGSRPISRQEMPKIYNMLENLCISRGLAMPRFEVIDSPALNAFASGINEKTYTITLTRGIIEALQDDELEAVIAHELAHIMNRDVRLLIVSVIFVGMISFLCEIVFRSLLHGGRVNHYRGSNNQRNALPILLIALLVLAIGYMFAIVIRFALSRKREYLADAGAVELTKNPGAMMRALMRISGQDKIRGMPDEVQQMCIENSARFMGIFATHPPIDKRIQTISAYSNEPIPELPVSLRRVPKRPLPQKKPVNAESMQPPLRHRPWG